MYVFRDGRRSIEGKFLLSGLQAALENLEDSSDPQQAIAPLLWAGGLEGALADTQSEFLDQAERLTDAVSDTVLGHTSKSPTDLLSVLAKIRFNHRVSISPPEGFAYYALHPLNFADLA